MLLKEERKQLMQEGEVILAKMEKASAAGHLGKVLAYAQLFDEVMDKLKSFELIETALKAGIGVVKHG